MGLFQRNKTNRRFEKEEKERQNALYRYKQLISALTPLKSFPEYPSLTEKPTYSIVVRQIVGSVDEVAKAIWEKWCFHRRRTGPYGDPESARALRALEGMLDNKDSACRFPWGVNQHEYRLHRTTGGKCMFVDIFYQQR